MDKDFKPLTAFVRLPVVVVTKSKCQFRRPKIAIVLKKLTMFIGGIAAIFCNYIHNLQ